MFAELQGSKRRYSQVIQLQEISILLHAISQEGLMNETSIFAFSAVSIFETFLQDPY